MKMKTSFSSNTRGGALVVVLFVIVTLGGVIGTALSLTSHNGRLAARQRAMARSTIAAEGMLDYAYASWGAALRTNNLTPGSADTLVAAGFTAPTISVHPGFTAEGITLVSFSLVAADKLGAALSSSSLPDAVATASVPGFTGRSGTSYFYRAEAKVSTGTLDTPVIFGARRIYQVSQVPLFQHIFAFEDTLEIYANTNMILSGPVHSNSDIWDAANNKLQFLDQVTYAGTYTESENSALWGNHLPGTPMAPYWSDNLQSPASSTVNAITAPSASRTSQLHEASRIEIFGTPPETLFNKTDTNPNNDGFREIIEPPVTGQTDPPQIASHRLYNQAKTGGILIQLDTAQLITSPARVRIWKGGSELASTNALYTSIKTAVLTQTTMYDFREDAYLQINPIDLRNLDTAVNALSGFNGVVYVHDINPYDKTAIRLERGTIFNRDYTFASENGVYIKGDFNVGDDSPSNIPSSQSGNSTGTELTVKSGYQMKAVAVAGDAITALSRNWDDANSDQPLNNRNAKHTTINAAILAGFIPSDYQGNGLPSGGARCFLRLLEDWSFKDLTFTGSIVQSFVSESLTAPWGGANVYSSPRNRWFQNNSVFSLTPPPGNFTATQFSRGRWEMVHLNE